MNIKVLLFLPLFLVTIGCLSKKKESVEEKLEVAGQEVEEPVKARKELTPLEEGTVILDEKDFGEVIELQGTQVVVDSEPFRLAEPEMLVKDDYFLMQNLNMSGENPGVYMLFRLPDFKYLTSFGIAGNGPDELIYPHIVPTEKQDILAYAYESQKNKLYEVGFDGKMSLVPVEFEKVPKAVHSDLRAFVTADNTYYYTQIVPRGSAFFRAQMLGDSMVTDQLYNISFSPQHKSWSAYIGDFLAHNTGNRLVYAYKYFKRILFYDPSTAVSRVVDFNKEGVVAANDIVTLGPDNVTFYWGASCTDNYIYLTYSGRTPIQVTRENQKTDGYIFVEQFDWNGNPVRKFRLDHWGSTVVDEANRKIYQVCYSYDDPIFTYDLPD